MRLTEGDYPRHYFHFFYNYLKEQFLKDTEEKPTEQDTSHKREKLCAPAQELGEGEKPLEKLTTGLDIEILILNTEMLTSHCK